MTRSVSRSASSNTSRSGTARSRNEPTSSPVNAPNPPGQNFTPNVHPSPASSRVYLRVQTPVTQPPDRVEVCSKVTFTLGCGSTSAVYDGRPRRSHRTAQYHSTNRPVTGPAGSRSSSRAFLQDLVPRRRRRWLHDHKSQYQ